MAKRFQITLAQLNPTVGDLEGNYKAALGAWQQAKKIGSDLIAFTESVSYTHLTLPTILLV